MGRVRYQTKTGMQRLAAGGNFGGSLRQGPREPIRRQYKNSHVRADALFLHRIRYKKDSLRELMGYRQFSTGTFLYCLCTTGTTHQCISYSWRFSRPLTLTTPSQYSSHLLRLANSITFKVPIAVVHVP